MSLVDRWCAKTQNCSTKPVYSIIQSLLAESNTEVCLRGNHPSLTKHRLDDKDLSVVLQCLTGDIASLNISYNRITDAGAEHLSEYLKNASCNLKYLDLSYNDITPSGIHAIADALQINTSLEHIILDGLSLERKGGIDIAAMLQVNTTLSNLSMACTDLHTDCIIAMATVLHGNCTIRSLDLSRPLLHSCLEESTIHISKMLKVTTEII
jgi:hypothetical protein